MLEPAPNGPAAPPPGRLPAEQTRLDMAGIVEQWRTRDPAVWADRPDLYPLVASYLRRAGEPLLAYDVALEGLGLWPKDVLLRQLLGLALADLGCAEVACGVLEPLAREAHPDARALEETLGILARVYKDIALGTHDAARRRHWLRKAYRAYATAHQRTGGHWTGINAATVAMLLGLRGAARTLARKVSRRCRADIARRDAPASIDDQYWLRATLGEAALIEGRLEEACDWYSRAVAAAPTAYRWIASSRRNAQLLARRLDQPWDSIARALPLPRVVVFAGHMIDRSGRPASCLADAIESELQAAIATRLDAIGPAICYASASCWADVLFLEAALERCYEALVVPPCEQGAFRSCGAGVATGKWAARLAVLIRRVHLFPPVTASRSRPGTVYCDFANRVLLGLARQRARELDAELIDLAADEILRSNATVRHRTPPKQHVIAKRRVRGAIPAVRALLFADVKNFSKMPEEMAAPFVTHVFGLVRRLARRHTIAPISRESRGDGFYLVFARVAQAGRFALVLSEHLRAVDWARIGLPADLTMRIALHAGPVLRTRDPVTGRTIYIGTHVNRVARIEAVTPPGQVYASQEFAALTALEHIRDFACHYVGQVPLAKRYGTFPMYHVRRQH